MSRVYVEKRQTGRRISEKAMRVLSPLTVGSTSEEGGVPALFTMNFPIIESRNEWVFFIVYTRFRRSYKLSVESIRPLQPNTRVVYATFLHCFTMPMQNETSSLRKHPFLLALRRWGRFARRNVCDSVAKMPY